MVCSDEPWRRMSPIRLHSARTHARSLLAPPPPSAPEPVPCSSASCCSSSSSPCPTAPALLPRSSSLGLRTRAWAPAAETDAAAAAAASARGSSAGPALEVQGAGTAPRSLWAASSAGPGAPPCVLDPSSAATAPAPAPGLGPPGLAPRAAAAAATGGAMPEAGAEEEALDSDPQVLGPKVTAAQEVGAGAGAGADAEEEEGAEVWESCLVVEGREVRRADVGSLRKATTRSLSKRSAGALFDWLLAPLPRDTFYSDVWERRPLLIRRPNARDYAAGLFGKADVEELLGMGLLHYGTNVDVTIYEDGQRRTLNGQGVADPAYVWQRYREGCSVRLLHPQQWNSNLWWLLSTLERHWQQLAGCNVYLTPAGSQGFSPHYDDIDAFVLQLEGSKRWRCYRPPSEQDFLARFSSPDFAEDAIGEPVLDTVLEPGDLLYMPRGTVHQAESTAASHSLHLTISVGQRNTMADFLQMALPRALELAAEEHVELRRSVPMDISDFMGVVNSDNDADPRRAAFLGSLQGAMLKILESGPWDSAVDQLAGSFMRSRLPPFQAQPEASTQASAESYTEARHDRKRARSERPRHRSLRAGQQMSAEALVTASVEGGCRLIVEDDNAVVYHMMDNARESHNEGEDGGGLGGQGEDSSGRIEFPLECAHWLEVLTSLSASEPTRIADIVERCNPGDLGRRDRGAVLSIVRTLLEHHVLQLHPSPPSS